MDREYNAAQNILVKGLEILGVEKKKSTAGHVGIQACKENHL